MNNTPKYSRLFISLAVVWTSVGQAVPAFAVDLEAPGTERAAITPVAPLAPLANGLVSPNLQTAIEIPTLPQAAAAGAAIMPLSAAQTAAAAPAATARLQAFSASARPQAASASSAEKATLLGRLTQAVGSALLGRGGVSWAQIFDASTAGAGSYGIRPLPRPNLPDGFNLGDAPKTPDPKKVRTVNITANAIDGPAARGAGGVFDAGPRVLNADISGTPAEIEANVKESLLKMVDADAAKWGVTRDELKEVHVRLIKGEGDQADTVYAYFQQQRKTTNTDGTTQNVVVHGTSLSFNVKIVKNQPILMSAMAKLYPNLNVATTATKTDDELKQGADRQLPQGSGIELVFAERRIVYHEGAWHAVNLYDIEGLPQAVGVRVAIDIATGEIFAWDSRVGVATEQRPDAGVRARFAIAYRGTAPLDPARAQAIKDKLLGAGLSIASEGEGGALIVAEGTVGQMAAIVGDKVFQGWTIHRYSLPKSAVSEPSAKLAAARAAAPAGARLIGVAHSFLNKSDTWAYRFFVPASNEVLEVYVNFQGKAQAVAPRPAPSDTNFDEIDLSKTLSFDAALRAAISLGAKPVAVRLERRQAMVGDHPVQFVFTDAQGKETVVPAGAETESLQAAAPAASAVASGLAKARAEKDDHRTADGKPVLVDLVLPHMTSIKIGGVAGTTDVDGKFSSKIDGAQAPFTATLEGKWAKINDEQGHPVQISANVRAGDGNIVFANDANSDLFTIDQVNTYISITRIHDWWSSRLRFDKRIDRQIPVNVNINQDCNAYYTPGRPSLNFFHESEECSDTGRPGVSAHEYGHFVDDMIGGITNGGMSEGWGDIGSMFLLGTPIIGEGFLKHRDPSWIRNGENTYQYNENDEVHDQGQAWMGFAWKLRKSLIAALGEAAGAAEAETLIVPTLFAKANDIPAQMAQVLLAGMDHDGNIRYEKEIRAAAKAHGIDLPKNPGVVGGIADAANGLVGLIVGGNGVAVEEVASGTFNADAHSLVPENFGQTETGEVVTKTFSLKAGRGARDRIRATLEGAYKYRSGEYHDLGFSVEESKGWRGSEFRVTITGSAKSVAYMAEQLRRIGGAR